MAVPAYAAAGSGATATGATISPGYPAGISAGDLLLLHISGQMSSGSGVVTPDGWTLVVLDESTNASYFGGVYIKTADGTESGSLSVTKDNDGLVSMARIYRFTGADSAEGVATAYSASGTTINAVSVTTTDVDRLALHLTFLIDVTANQGAPIQASITGESGGNWTEALAEYTSTTGRDESLGLQTADMASAGTISGGSFNTNHSVTSFRIGLAIYQAPAAVTSLVYQSAAPTIYRL